MDQVLNQVRDQLSWRLFSLQARLNNASKSHDDMGDGKANASNTQSKPFHSELDGVKEIETAISSMTVTTVEGPIANLNTDCLIAIFCSLPSFADVTNFSGACCAFKSSCNANVNLISNTVGSRAMSFYEEARDLVEVQEARLKLSRVTWLERTLRMEINHIQVFWAFLLIEKRPYRRNVSDRRTPRPRKDVVYHICPQKPPYSWHWSRKFLRKLLPSTRTSLKTRFHLDDNEKVRFFRTFYLATQFLASAPASEKLSAIPIDPLLEHVQACRVPALSFLSKYGTEDFIRVLDMLAFTGLFWKTFSSYGQTFCYTIWTDPAIQMISSDNQDETAYVYNKVQNRLVAPLVYDHCQFLVGDLCRVFPKQSFYWISQHFNGSIVSSDRVPNGTSLLLCCNSDAGIAFTRLMRSELHQKARLLITELFERKMKTNGRVNFVECSCIAMSSGRCLPRVEQTRSTSSQSSLQWLRRLIPRATKQV